MLDLVIETKESVLVEAIKEAYNKALKTTNYNDFVNTIKETTFFNCGEGGSHIWISDPETTKRLAIIYK